MARVYYRERRGGEPPWIRKVVKDEIRALRSKNSALRGFDIVDWESFWEKYGETLEKILKEVYYDLMAELTDLLVERAYLEDAFEGENTDYYQTKTKKEREKDKDKKKDDEGYPTGQFLNAWDIECKFDASNRLSFNLIYNYKKEMGVRKGVHSHLGLHTTYDGVDFRLALADYLDFPRIVWNESSGSYRRSKGHWQSYFDKYCRTEGVKKFNELCKKAGII